MCEIKEKTRLKTFTGYKVVIKKDGKYYSPSTGLEYKVGMKLPHLQERNEIFDTWAWGNPLSKDGVWYKPEMQGKTAVFKNLRPCVTSIACNRAFNHVILKMTIGGEIYNGSFSYNELRIGTEIVDIKETKYKPTTFRTCYPKDFL
jgi:hypothetical protein